MDLVRQKGLEPSRLAAPEPKSGVSTNFTTGAAKGEHYKHGSRAGQLPRPGHAARPPRGWPETAQEARRRRVFCAPRRLATTVAASDHSGDSSGLGDLPRPMRCS